MVTDDELQNLFGWVSHEPRHVDSWRMLFSFTLQRQLTLEETWDAIRRINAKMKAIHGITDDGPTWADVVRADTPFWRATV